MNGLHKSIADQIPVHPEFEGLPEGSFFAVQFEDGSWRAEHDTRWSDISEYKVVDYFGMKKQVLVCKYPVRKLAVSHDNLKASIDVPKGYQVFQAIRSRLLIVGGEQHPSIVGRCLGLVYEGEVVEEQFLNGIQQEVTGMRK